MNLMRRDRGLLCKLVAKTPCEAPALQIAFQLLFSFALRVDFFSFCFTLAPTVPLGQAIDQLILETAQQLFGIELDASPAVKVKWRISDEGFSFQSRSGAFAAAAWPASWTQYYHVVHARTAWRLQADSRLGSLRHAILASATLVLERGARNAKPFLSIDGWRS